VNPAILTEHSTDVFAALRHRIDGSVVTPQDSDWDEARTAWNLAVDQRPVAVAIPESADDVVAIVDYAREHGFRVAPQGTGHGSPSMTSLEGAILLRTTRMKDVTIHADERWARVEAGAEWIDVLGPASQYDLAPMVGSSHDVGVVGYTLGGGMGFIGRKHGLSAHNVRAIEVVTADGRHVRTDPEHEPELFWALRGGGGSFGVVTAIEIELHHLPELVTGALFFEPERAVEVLTAYVEWTKTTPDEVATSGRVMYFPPLPGVPEPLQDNSYVVIDGAYIGPEAEANEVLAPLRALNPIMDTFAVADDTTALAFLHMDPPEPVPGAGDATMASGLTPEAIERFVTAGAVGESPLLMIELRQLGGAVARPSATDGAVGAIDEDFIVFAVGIPTSPEVGEVIERQVDKVLDAVAPWETGRRYLNLAERPADAADFYSGSTYARLTRVRSVYDPYGLFQSNHTIAP
jgi:FAD/FMN-containing dehydrogenase